MNIGYIIKSDQCLLEGVHWLSQHEPRFKHVLSLTGTLDSRLRSDGFSALLQAICSQQISVAAATSIWQRIENAGFTNPEKILAASEESLRSCGLSRPKIRYAKALADSGIDYDGLRDLPNDEVIKQLVKVIGIGVWTAEIYAMFSLGRADVFASGDLALQEATRILFDFSERPKEKEMAKIAKDWSPWRSVAARLLWAYYKVEKNREGI